jgi:hypothetical protein
MKCIFAILALGFFSTGAMAAANTWSACSTVVGVSDYRGATGNVILSLSPTPSYASGACNGGVGITGGVTIAVGSNGITSDIVKGMLAIGSAANLAGKKVMVFYDNGSSSCNVGIVAQGGYQGQCN